ncbi:hypothetical protein GLOIN_2v1836052 [Rhizophagus clarus]|nr:hypothetical protein GLOIN_2v1836052 [Rhizophagus clarus]
MKIVLEYIYTGSIKEESLTKDNIIESFYAADYFQLTNLQGYILRVVKDTLEKNHTDNYSPELLSKIAKIMPFIEDDVLQNLLIEKVATIPLNTIEFGRLSIAGLQYLLSRTYEKVKSFATPEYEVFRYSAILAAKQVSNNAFRTLMKRLPTLSQIENSFQVENDFIIDNQKVTKELKPLIKFIDFNQINGKILTDIIEPLKIIPTKIILDAYRQKARTHCTDLYGIRGIHNNFSWDESACGKNLIIEENGKVVSAVNCNSYQSVKAKMEIGGKGKGIFEWDVIIEKTCRWSWVGVCTSESINHDIFSANQSASISVLGSDGVCWNYNKSLNYCSSFGNGARITVHLDMNKRTCCFTVNGVKYPEAFTWNKLPSKFYPIVGLMYPGRFRIQSC